MRKLNYFGLHFSKLKLSGFILASLGAQPSQASTTHGTHPERKKEVTKSIKTEDVAQDISQKSQDDGKK